MAARTAKLNSATTVQWTNAENFDGFVAIGIAFPGSYVQVSLDENAPPQRIPQWTKVQIVNGKYNQSTTLFLNADIEPPNTQYAAYFYDATNTLIAPAAGTAALFSITADPYTLTPPTLTAPTAAVTPPSPET